MGNRQRSSARSHLGLDQRWLDHSAPQKDWREAALGISPALSEVLDEIRAEYQQVPNLQRLVFTKDAKRIPAHTLQCCFAEIVRKAKVEGFQLRDFRHCARTRWAAAGLSFEIAESGLGHKLRGISGTYLNLTDDHVRAAFRAMFTRCSREKSEAIDAKEKSA
jgi:integrase